MNISRLFSDSKTRNAMCWNIWYCCTRAKQLAGSCIDCIIAPILVLLREHQEDVGFQQQVCPVVSALAKNSDNIVEIIQNGWWNEQWSVTISKVIIQEHANSIAADIQEHANSIAGDIQETTWVLQYPSKVPRVPCCSAHVGNGVCNKTILSAPFWRPYRSITKTKHQFFNSVLLDCEALAMLSSCSEDTTIVAVVPHGGINAILKARMRVDRPAAAIQTHGCVTLCNFAGLGNAIHSRRRMH